MGDANFLKSSQPVQIVGGDETHAADVSLTGGVKRLAVDAIVTVEQLFGRDPQGTTYFFLNTQYDAGGISTGDTVRVQIAAGPILSLFPAVDVTTVATAAEALASNPEAALAELIVNTLNADANFSLNFKARRIKDFSGVFISAKAFNEWGERKTPGDFNVTTTGTVTALMGFDTVERRGYGTELARSPNDPRLGVLAISGTVFAVPGGAGDLTIENLKTVANLVDMRVNGSLINVTFSIGTNATKSKFINEIRFYGGANSLKFEQFLGINTVLTNGLLIEIKSDNQLVTLPVIKATEDFKNKFAFGSGNNFRIDIQSGTDQFLAVFSPDTPIILKKTGTFGAGNDDYIKVTVRDNLSASLSELECLARGFLREE